MCTRHSRPRVVLADDYADLLTALQRLLAPSCDVVALVSDGADLRGAVSGLKPDVVVLDVQMPSINGLLVCQQIRDALPDTKVVMVSADGDSDIRDGAVAAGASAFVPKYRIGVDLVRAVNHAFSRTGVLEN
jgi:DNA-binding NarL/FixJ family response regulator